MDIRYADFSLKNIKTFQGMEGEGFNATLSYNDKEIGMIINGGDGGPTYLESRAKNQELIDSFLKSEEAIKLGKKYDDELNKQFGIVDHLDEPDALEEETFYEIIFEKFLLAKDIKKLTKKYGLIFRISESDPGLQYYTPAPKKWTASLFEALAASTKAKYPEAIIMNDELDIYPVFN